MLSNSTANYMDNGTSTRPNTLAQRITTNSLSASTIAWTCAAISAGCIELGGGFHQAMQLRLGEIHTSRAAAIYYPTFAIYVGDRSRSIQLFVVIRAAVTICGIGKACPTGR